MKTEAKVLLGTLIVGIGVLVGLIVWNQISKPSRPAPQVSSEILVRPDSNIRSTAPVKVTVVEFGDYECPACSFAHPILEEILKANEGRFNFVFRHFPLAQHKQAMLAAETAEAAGEQGKYWEMHDKLYRNQSEWSKDQNPLEIMQRYATELSLDMTKFNQALESDKFVEKIKKDRQDGLTAGVDATPSFFINNTKYEGLLNYQDILDAIEAEMAK